MVSRTLEEISDREISTGLAFVLPKNPKELGLLYISGSKMELSEPIIAHGELAPETTVSHLTGVSFLRDEADEIDNYLKARSGNMLNLDDNEIAAFNTLARQELNNATAKIAVETQLRSHLLNRYRTYRSGGIRAINPYLRDDSERYYPGIDLDRALKSFRFIEYFFPDIYRNLSGGINNKRL